MTASIHIAHSDLEIQSCFPVMQELRPHLQPDEFLRRVTRQADMAGYQLAYVADGEVKAVAGFRISECLAWGRFLYVDDLVSKSDARSKGYGGLLFDWLVALATSEGCDQLHLDSGVHRFDAHRLYLKKRMRIEAPHFGLLLNTT